MMVMMVMMLLPMVILLMTLRRGFNRKEPAVTSLEAKFTVSLSSFIWICVYKLFLTVKVMSKSLPWWILQDSIDEGVGIKDDDEDDDDDDGDFKAEQGRQLTETMPQFLELLVDSSPGCVFFLFYFSSIAVFILTVLICSLLQLTSFQAVFISIVKNTTLQRSSIRELLDCTWCHFPTMQYDESFYKCALYVNLAKCDCTL